jgi:hypothetical protein
MSKIFSMLIDVLGLAGIGSLSKHVQDNPMLGVLE